MRRCPGTSPRKRKPAMFLSPGQGYLYERNFLHSTGFNAFVPTRRIRRLLNLSSSATCLTYHVINNIHKLNVDNSTFQQNFSLELNPPLCSTVWHFTYVSENVQSFRMSNEFSVSYRNIMYLPSPPPPPTKKEVKKEKEELTKEDILLKGGTGPKIKDLQFDTTATLVGWSQAD